MNFKNYFDELHKALKNVEVTHSVHYTLKKVSLDEAIEILINILDSGIKKSRLMIIGNGGSAAIAVHMLNDYTNAAGVRTLDFMSPSLLTCMANDYGYESVFAKPIERHADSGDILFAISSSGKSANIVKACRAAKIRGCTVVTFSGFSPDNILRRHGHLNFYVPASRYGFVELAHEVLLHCILDLFIERKNK